MSPETTIKGLRIKHNKNPIKAMHPVQNHEILKMHYPHPFLLKILIRA